MFKRTTAVNKIGKMTARKRVVQGGTSASKTYSILAILINKALKEPNLEISVVSESIPHLRRGALKDFLKIMVWIERYKDEQFNKSTLTYRFHNGSYIEFFSADQPDKMRGARRNILYVNEANNIDFESYYQMAIRTSGIIYIDFNPTAEFWAHKEVLQEKDSEFLKLTYLDNEALPESIVKEIEANREKAKKSKYWANWWKVYGLGEVGSLEGVILEDWQEINTVPNEARLIGYGMDFGFSNSYTAVVGVYEWNETYILDEVFYKRGVYPYQIYEAIKDEVGWERIWADHARPDSIKELSDLGFRIKEAEKPRDATESFLDKMHRNTFFVSSRSENIKTELRNWVWAKDKTGESLNVPIKDYDHAMDAVKYCLISQNRYSGRY